jgi:hypothetical protein
LILIEHIETDEESPPTQAERRIPAPSCLTAAAVPMSSSRIPLLVLVYAFGLVLFLAIEPTKTWILMVVTGLVALGVDGTLRTHPRAVLEEDIVWTAPLLFLPTLMALGAGLFLEDALDGYWILPGAGVAAVLMGATLYAEYVTVDPYGPAYTGARFLLNLGTFLTAFAFYSVVCSFDVSLVPAAIVVGLISVLLSVELLRESDADPRRALVYAATIGIIVAQARWALYFLPLESYLAGVFLLLVFYLTSGLVQHHLNDDLRTPVITEFAAIAILGVIIVTIGRIFESGTS